MVLGIRLRLVIRWLGVKAFLLEGLTRKIIQICRRSILPRRLDQMAITAYFYLMLPELQAFPSQTTMEVTRQMLSKPGTPKH